MAEYQGILRGVGWLRLAAGLLFGFGIACLALGAILLADAIQDHGTGIDPRVHLVGFVWCLAGAVLYFAIGAVVIMAGAIGEAIRDIAINTRKQAD